MAEDKEQNNHLQKGTNSICANLSAAKVKGRKYWSSMALWWRMTAMYESNRESTSRWETYYKLVISKWKVLLEIFKVR